MQAVLDPLFVLDNILITRCKEKWSVLLAELLVKSVKYKRMRWTSALGMMSYGLPALTIPARLTRISHYVHKSD